MFNHTATLTAYPLLADYAARSPWLTQVFQQAHIIEFPFYTSLGETQDKNLVPFHWLPSGKRGEVIQFADALPPYPTMVMLGPQPTKHRGFMLAISATRGSTTSLWSFEEMLQNARIEAEHVDWAIEFCDKSYRFF